MNNSFISTNQNDVISDSESNKIRNDIETNKNRSESISTNNIVIIFILPYSMRELEIQEFCQSVGEVLDIRLSTHANSNRSKGWA